MNDPHLLAWASVTNPLANDPRKGNKQELAGFWQDGTNLTFSQTRWLILFNNLCWRQTLDNFKYPLHSFSLTKYRWTSKKKEKIWMFFLQTVSNLINSHRHHQQSWMDRKLIFSSIFTKTEFSPIVHRKKNLYPFPPPAMISQTVDSLLANTPWQTYSDRWACEWLFEAVFHFSELHLKVLN